MPNALGLERADYKGGQSTLCPGCGHDSISNQIISVAYDANLPISWAARTPLTPCTAACPRLPPARRPPTAT
jgi:2-oxoglutarate/2-oxoacid ferredoxin oxidoreductase subunit beta